MDKWLELNNRVISGNQVDPTKDTEALQSYFQDKVNPNTQFFHNILEKKRYMIDHNLWDAQMLSQYSDEEITEVFSIAYAQKFRFKAFMGAYKFYREYATKTPDGSRWLERYEDRMALTALARCARHADRFERAKHMVVHLVNQRFTPATPTLMNSGKANTGRLVSCFLLQTCNDDLSSITKTLAFIAELSKGGGGIGVEGSNLRARGERLRNIENATKGVMGVAKMFDHILRYADQAGQRPGAGALYLSVMHPDFQEVLASKKIASDEDSRLKTLSIGAVIPDIFMQKVRDGEDFYQFYPYTIHKALGREFTDIDWDKEYQDLVDNPQIRKRKVNTRRLLEDIAITQGESGYPYILFQGTANRANPLPNVGSIKMSNLCSEILQPTLTSKYNSYGKEGLDRIGLDVSCNLASVVIEQSLEVDLGDVVSTAIDMLDDVAQSTSIDEVPSVKRANDEMRSIGLGAMGLHSFLAKNSIAYGSPEALEFCDVYFAAMHYHARKRSMEIARDTGFVFKGFKGSRYESGEYFKQYLNQDFEPISDEIKEIFKNQKLPTREDWKKLTEDIKEHGLAHSFVSAIAPTGSISYISNASASIMPITEKVEVRTSGSAKTIYPMPHLSMETEWFYEEAYDMDQRRVVDTVATVQKHIDQGISCTLFVPSDTTTSQLQEIYLHAYRRGVKTLYYTRMRKRTIEECLACAV